MVIYGGFDLLAHSLLPILNGLMRGNCPIIHDSSFIQLLRCHIFTNIRYVIFVYESTIMIDNNLKFKEAITMTYSHLNRTRNRSMHVLIITRNQTLCTYVTAFIDYSQP